MTTPAKTAPFEKLLQVLEAIHGARPDTTVAQAQTFMMLMNLGGKEDKDVRQEDIGDRLGISQGHVSTHLGKFVDAGLLTKDFAPDNERVKVYRLTAGGKKLIFKIQEALGE